MKARPALIVFARAPIPGQTKTRLIPALGAEQAAELHRRFLLDILSSASRLAAHLIVAVAGPADTDFIRAAVAEASPEAEITAQSGDDLGQRMHNTLGETLSRGHPCAVVIGTDAPSLPFDRVTRALDLARQDDLVLGPALDGGYYLIGLHRVIPVLFRGIAWGSSTVLIDTLQAARNDGCSVSLLEPWYDVDTTRDLALLCSHLTALSLAGETIPCPHTWDYIQDLALKA